MDGEGGEITRWHRVIKVRWKISSPSLHVRLEEGGREAQSLYIMTLSSSWPTTEKKGNTVSPHESLEAHKHKSSGKNPCGLWNSSVIL